MYMIDFLALHIIKSIFHGRFQPVIKALMNSNNVLAGLQELIVQELSMDAFQIFDT